MADYGESIRAFRLYEKTSKSGNTYLVGRWGSAKVAVLKSREVADDGSAMWDVLFSPAPERQKHEARSRPEQPTDTANGPSADQTSASSGLSDEIPF
jgi:hypothetical protein